MAASGQRRDPHLLGSAGSPHRLGDCSSKLEELCQRYWWCPSLVRLSAALQGLDDIHGIPHTVRVLCNVLQLLERLEPSQRLEVDEESLLIATLLHDTGRALEHQTGRHHAELGALIADAVARLMRLDGNRIEKIKSIIVEHSFSFGEKPRSIESCILSDADKLDALGMVGLYRAIGTGARVGRNIEGTIGHYYEKLAILPDKMCLEVSKSLARERLTSLAASIETLESELSQYVGSIKLVLGKIVKLGLPGGGSAEHPPPGDRRRG